MDDAPVAAPRTSRSRGALKALRELPIIVVTALAIAMLIKAFLVQPFYIQQQSMLPTLQPSERVLVSKLHYRFGEPQRGDIVIFRNPRNPCHDDPSAPGCARSFPQRAFEWVAEAFGLPVGGDEHLVKRIVALPGETVEMNDGEVYVCDDTGCDPTDDGRKISLESSGTSGPQTDGGEFDARALGSESYWVLGDNRAQSSDSRNFGAVDRDEIVGKVFVVLWPPTRFRGL